MVGGKMGMLVGIVAVEGAEEAAHCYVMGVESLPPSYGTCQLLLR